MFVFWKTSLGWEKFFVWFFRFFRLSGGVLKSVGLWLVVLMLFSFVCLAESGDGRSTDAQVRNPDRGDGSMVEVKVHPDSGIKVRLRQYLEILPDLPTHGFLPVRYEITNERGEDRSFLLQIINQKGGAYRKVLHVPAGKNVSTLVFIPAEDLCACRDSKVLLRLRDRKDRFVCAESRLQGMYGLYLLGVSPACREKEYVKKLKDFSAVRTSLFDAGDLPADPRIFSAMDVFCLGMAEYESWGLERRQALLAWVNGGGVLWVDEFKPGKGLTEGSYGLGEIKGSDESMNVFASFRRDREYFPEHDFEGIKEKMASAGSGRPLPSAFYALLMLGFIILIPVNFYGFAPPGKRRRLLWTTPLIALMAGASLWGYHSLIRFNSGEGYRYTLVQLAPDVPFAYVNQLQFYVCGTSRIINSVPIDPRMAVSVGGAGQSNSVAWHVVWENQGRMLRDDDGLTQGYFSSRRSRVESSCYVPAMLDLEQKASEEGCPVLVVKGDVRLSGVAFRDAEGRLWYADELLPDRPVKLRGKSVWDRGEKPLEKGCFQASCEVSGINRLETRADHYVLDKVVIRGSVRGAFVKQEEKK